MYVQMDTLTYKHTHTKRDEHRILTKVHNSKHKSACRYRTKNAPTNMEGTAWQYMTARGFWNKMQELCDSSAKHTLDDLKQWLKIDKLVCTQPFHSHYQTPQWQSWIIRPPVVSHKHILYICPVHLVLGKLAPGRNIILLETNLYMPFTPLLPPPPALHYGNKVQYAVFLYSPCLAKPSFSWQKERAPGSIRALLRRPVLFNPTTIQSEFSSL